MTFHGVAVLVSATLALVGCRKENPERRQVAGAASGAATMPAAGAGSPIAASATALFAELSSTSQSLPELHGKYDDGVLVSGTVDRIFTDRDTTFVHLKSGAETHVALTFLDEGAVAREKIKVADSMTALCRLGGMSGPREATLGNCVLR
jgi:hypothetical protein